MRKDGDVFEPCSNLLHLWVSDHFYCGKSRMCFCAAEAGSGWRMTDMKGLTCHTAFDLLSLEQDKRGAKCQVIQVTHPQTHISAHREGFGDEWFIIKKPQNPPAILWMACKNSKMIIFMKIIVTGGTRSACQPQDFHALFFPWVCLFLL